MPPPFPRKRYLVCASGRFGPAGVAWEPVAELGIAWRQLSAKRVLGIGGPELSTVSGRIPKRPLNSLENRLAFANDPLQHQIASPPGEGVILCDQSATIWSTVAGSSFSCLGGHWKA